MGGCVSSVGDEKAQDEKHTDNIDAKEEEKEADVISPRTISVQPMESREVTAATVDPMSHAKTQDDVSVGLANTLVVKQDARPQPHTTLHVNHTNATEAHRDELVTSTSDRYEKGTQARHSQGYRKKDGGEVSYRNEDTGTVDLKLQIQELRIERNEMFKLNNEFMKEKEHLWNSLVQKEKEVDELRTRLSRVAFERLTDNNPNVADLSDPNRPVKIADRYIEVYSNEWSDAFEDLVATGDRTDQEAIQILLEFIENIYNMCLNISTNNAKDLNTNILLFTGHIFRGADMKISTNLSSAMKPFKDERKLMYKEFLPTLCTETNKLRDIKLVKKKDRTKKLQKYLDTATELCWLMCIQDPPVHLYTDCKQGHKFDENNFSAFTVRGTTVDYLVWPALHLCQNGPILKKGVAQAKATNKENRTENKTKL